jgi:hypothetical protein
MAHRRSLGFARDDKERVVARKGRLLNRGIFQTYLDKSEVQPSLRDWFRDRRSHASSLALINSPQGDRRPRSLPSHGTVTVS